MSMRGVGDPEEGISSFRQPAASPGGGDAGVLRRSALGSGGWRSHCRDARCRSRREGSSVSRSRPSPADEVDEDEAGRRRGARGRSRYGRSRDLDEGPRA